MAETGNQHKGKVVLFWALVGIPLLWGVSQTFVKAMALFT